MAHPPEKQNKTKLVTENKRQWTDWWEWGSQGYEITLTSTFLYPRENTSICNIFYVVKRNIIR